MRCRKLLFPPGAAALERGHRLLPIIAELQVLLARDKKLKLKLAALDSSPTTVGLHPAARDRYLSALSWLHDTLGKDGQTEASKVVKAATHVSGTACRHESGPGMGNGGSGGGT